AYADAGQLLNYEGPTSFAQTGEFLTTCANVVVTGVGPLPLCNDTMVRSSVGVGLIWDSPFGPLRFDLAYALTKQPWDHTQLFRFGGGPRSGRRSPGRRRTGWHERPRVLHSVRPHGGRDRGPDRGRPPSARRSRPPYHQRGAARPRGAVRSYFSRQPQVRRR